MSVSVLTVASPAQSPVVSPSHSQPFAALPMPEYGAATLTAAPSEASASTSDVGSPRNAAARGYGYGAHYANSAGDAASAGPASSRTAASGYSSRHTVGSPSSRPASLAFPPLIAALNALAIAPESVPLPPTPRALHQWFAARAA